jgi:hypothetical protein
VTRPVPHFLTTCGAPYAETSLRDVTLVLHTEGSIPLDITMFLPQSLQPLPTDAHLR